MADNETLNKKQQQSLLKHINKWSQNTETDSILGNTDS